MLRYKTQFIWFIVMVLLIGSLVGASLGERVQAAPGDITETQSTVSATKQPTFTPTGAAIASPAIAAPATATSTPVAPVHLVISEFRSRGPLGDNDEFVELFNPTGAAVNIGGWTIRSSSSCGTNIFSLSVIPNNTILLAGQHYLVVSNNSSLTVSADQHFLPRVTNGLTDDGGLALADLNGQTVDQVGMCISTLYHEGMNLLPLSGAADQSYERGPGGSTACYDINNNAGDFALISPSTPLNLSSPITLCNGVPTSTPTQTATDTPLHSPTSTYTPSLSPTATITGGPLITFTPTAPVHLVISEFRSRGPLGDNDEFVELFNPTGAAVNIGGWIVRRSSSCGGTIYNLFFIPTNVILQAGQHYLGVSSTNSSLTVGADLTFAAGLEEEGGIALADPTGQVVDAVGMCISTLYHEGMNLLPLSGTTNVSYERRPGGNTACYDTNNNAGDFALISPPNPQDLASLPITLCGGVLTSTPTRTPTITPTRSLTRRSTEIPFLVIINEFLPHPHTDWNDDGVVNVGDEFIEIINMSSSPVSITGWKLDNGINTTSYALPNVTMLSHQILVFFHSETGLPLSDGGGTVRMVKANGQTADIYNYPPVEAIDRTWCRLPTYGALAFSCLPSPGKPNIPFNPILPTPESTPVTGGLSDCSLADTVPQAVTSAECGGTGAGISNAVPENQFWLPQFWKWDVFVE